MRLHHLIAALLLAHPADAGAWMRDEGTVFLSFSGSIDQAGGQNASVYVEYGLRPKLTLGFKADVDRETAEPESGSAYVFARRPLPTGNRSYKLAYELGLGGTMGSSGPYDVDPFFRLGLSYGRGITLWEKSGWLAVDGALEWHSGADTVTAKLDATVGLNLNDRFKVMVQVFHTDADHFETTTLAPSVIWTPGRDRANSYQFGIESDTDGTGIKLGVWRFF